jgi:hypothetical protein
MLQPKAHGRSDVLDFKHRVWRPREGTAAHADAASALYLLQVVVGQPSAEVALHCFALDASQSPLSSLSFHKLWLQRFFAAL